MANFQALPPYWIDQVIGEERDAQAIARAFAFNPKFLHIIQIGVDKAKLAETARRGYLLAIGA
jgi:hypothetical protein